MAIYLSNRDGDGKTNEEGHYRLLSKVLEGQALLSDDLKVVENSPVGLSVLVTAGDYRLQTAGDYAYMGWISSDEVVEMSSPDPSNPRISTIVLYVDKNEETAPLPPNNPGIAKLMAVDGAASSTPVAPNSSTIQTAVGAGNPFIKLAEVSVGAGVTQITNSNITDYRETIKIVDEIIARSDIMSLVGPILMPVGTIYRNATNSTNPAELFGFGTWELFAQGRVLVGVDPTDTDFDDPLAIGGSKSVTLTQAQIPSHSHTVDPPATTTTTDAHTHSITSILDNLGGGNTNNALTSYPGANVRITNRSTSSDSHNHTVNIGQFNSGSVGSGQPHTNLQPYVTVYTWRRTA